MTKEHTIMRLPLPCLGLIMLMVCTCCWTRHAAAQVHAGDIYVGLAQDRLIIGRINTDQTIDTSVRVFGSVFGDSGFDGFTANPGYDAEPIFNPADRIGFNILSPLQVWNGDGFEATAGETLTLSFLTLSRTTGECVVSGFDLAVQSNGGWHRHLNMFLNPVPPAASGASGVYMISLELYSTNPAIGNSLPYWLVFNHNAPPKDHQSAIAWVNANLVQPPCPSDIDRNGQVNVSDLLAVISAWGSAACSPADVNNDGVVNVSDLLAVISAWGDCP